MKFIACILSLAVFAEAAKVKTAAKIKSKAAIKVAAKASQGVCTDMPGADSAGDSCSWYADGSSCSGTWNTDDFVASVNCCGCDGGLYCDAGDSFGDGCAWYADNLGSCGNYDTASFAADACCPESC